MKEPRQWTAVEEEAVYAEIGRFFVLFQALESELFQICWLLGEPRHNDEDRNKLADLSYSKLVSATKRRVDAFLLTAEEAESEFARRFHELLGRCRRHGTRRNGIAHSGYIFLESGDDLYGIVRADMTKGADGTQFDYETVEPANIRQDSREIASTAFGLSQARLQLIHWTGRVSSEPPTELSPTATTPGKTAPWS